MSGSAGVLAIELGASMTRAALQRGDAPPVAVELSPDGPAMSSAVVVEAGADGGLAIHVGDEATRRADDLPHALLASPRSHLGEDVWDFGGHQVALVEVLEAQLREIIERASTQAGAVPGGLLLTHPDHWSDHRPDRLIAAARAAFDGPIFLLGEAVARAAWQERADGSVRLPVALVDVDESATHVAVVGPGPELLAAGEVPLGGTAVDAALMRAVFDDLREVGEGELVDRVVADRFGADILGLRQRVRGARGLLAHGDDVTVPLGGDGAVVTLTPDRLAGIAAPLVERIAAEVRAVAERAGVRLAELTAVRLTGEAAGLVEADALGAALDRPVAALTDPHAVTFGALFHAAGHPDLVAEPERTGTQTGAHPVGEGRRSRALPIMATIAAALVLALAVVLVMRPWERPTAPSARPAPGTSPEAPVPDEGAEQPSQSDVADRQRLAGLVQRDSRECEFEDQPGPAGELVQMTCPGAVLLGTRTGWVTYTLFPDDAQADRQLDALAVGRDQRCPSPGVGDYDIEGRRGRVACTPEPAVFWHQQGIPVVAGYAAPGATLAELFTFWEQNSRL